MDDEVGPPLTEEEGRMLVNLLARHCAHGLDQWDTWRLVLPTGDFFVVVDSAPPVGWLAESFYQVWPPKTA
jgi:hypothetical protein